MAPASELNFLTTLLPLAGIIFIIAVGVILLNQHFQKNLIRQRLQHEELKNNIQYDLFRASMDAQEIERKRIASNLHDEIGAVLSISRMHLVNMERQSEPKDAAALQSLRELIETALQSMRRISHELMPPQLESFGLIHTLKTVISQLKQVKFEVQLSCTDEHMRWPGNVELGLYRICMELLNNTLKHADATLVQIRIEELAGVIIFYYTDDGKGLPVEPLENDGLGFKSIQARVATLGGEVRLGNREPQGFETEISLRINSRNNV